MQCSICSKLTTVGCGACGQPYCTLACQQTDWATNNHKQVCIAGPRHRGPGYPHRAGYRRASHYGPYGRGWYGGGRFYPQNLLIPAMTWATWAYLINNQYRTYPMTATNQYEMQLELDRLRRENAYLRTSNRELIADPKHGRYVWVEGR